MNILKKIRKLKYTEPRRIVLKDKNISVLTPKEIQKFREEMRSVQEDLRTSKLLNQSLDETIMLGIELAKANNRVIATEETNNL